MISPSLHRAKADLFRRSPAGKFSLTVIEDLTAGTILQWQESPRFFVARKSPQLFGTVDGVSLRTSPERSREAAWPCNIDRADQALSAAVGKIMIVGILVAAGTFLLSTAVVLWLSARAPILEECDCEECRTGRRRSSHAPPPAELSHDSGGEKTARSRDAAPGRKSTRRKARMMPVDHPAGRPIFGPSGHAGFLN